MEIVGRLTRDAEVRSVGNEKQVVSFSVAVNDSYRNRDGERVRMTEFFDCSYWLATGVAEYLTKGTLVELTGWITARAWQDSNGEARAALNCNVSRIRLHGSPQEQQRETKPEEKPEEKPRRGRKRKSDTAEDDLPF
ncbi:MAG: single-stranded DNA-binding protein [Spirochaetales bacterium]|nr:single-stranded DNA-binding protein [Spirochaetales bacterium]